MNTYGGQGMNTYEVTWTQFTRYQATVQAANKEEAAIVAMFGPQDDVEILSIGSDEPRTVLVEAEETEEAKA